MRQRSNTNVSQSPQGSFVSVLLVSERQHDHVRLSAIFEHSNWVIHLSRSCREAAKLLESRPIAVVICDSSLQDGGWRWLLDHVSSFPAPPVLIVACPEVDDALWAEVLNLGAYDVLMKPFDTTEVTRIVSLAWLYWKDHMGAGHPAKPAQQTSRTRFSDVA